MVIGETMHQFILDYHFINQKLSTVTLTCVIYVPQVSYMHCAHHLMGVLYNAGNVDIITEAVSALRNACQLNNCLLDNSTLQCFINNGASDDRAVECSISSHYSRNGRRRLVILEATTTNIQCKYVSDTLTFNLMGK